MFADWIRDGFEFVRSAEFFPSVFHEEGEVDDITPDELLERIPEALRERTLDAARGCVASFEEFVCDAVEAELEVNSEAFDGFELENLPDQLDAYFQEWEEGPYLTYKNSIEDPASASFIADPAVRRDVETYVSRAASHSMAAVHRGVVGEMSD